MPDPAIAKVEDAWAAALSAWPALAGYTILTDQSEDIALDADCDPTIAVYTVAYEVDQADEQNQSIHTAIIEFEAVNRTQTVGTISRANHTAIAHMIGAIHADRTLGGMLQDTQEVDVAPAGANGKDVGSASLQINVQFFTPRGDWFTILGHGGLTF